MKFLKSSNDKLTVESSCEEDTRAIGAILGGFVYAGLLVMLKGTLGMGKTCLTQGIGSALGAKRVKSPTFIIMSEHEGKIPLLHVDLYRLEDETEIEGLGIEEYLDDGYAAVVEWSERWKYPPNRDIINIEISALGEDKRLISFSAEGGRARSVIAGMSDKIKSDAEDTK